MDEFDPEIWFHRRAAYYVEAQLLYHLNVCGVWSHLQQQESQTAHQIAEALGLEEGVLEDVLDFVVGVDVLLERDAKGRFSLSSQGRRVLERFGRGGDKKTTYNFFDVRVGAYGSVWENVGSLLRGEIRYGEDLQRTGEIAADAVYKVGAKMAPGLARVLAKQSIQWEMEFGVTTGLLEAMASALGERKRVGLDRSVSALQVAKSRADDHGITGISWVEADLADVADWSGRLSLDGSGVFYSVHFHEFLSKGKPWVQTLLSTLGQQYPGAFLVAIEQPAPEDGANELLGLYGHSNRLIHHLIGNGVILGELDWVELFEDAGCRLVGVESMGYLGYKAFVVELGCKE